MIESLRRWGSSWPAKILLGLLAISMGIFWGVSDIFTRDQSSAVVATVGDSEILAKDLHHELRIRLSQIEHKTGRRLTQEQVIASRLAFSILTDLIERKVLDKEADRQELAISDRSVQEAVIKDPQFHGEDKNFSRKKFLQFLQSSGLHERQFLAFFKKELRRRQLLTGFLAPFQPSDSLSRLLLNAQFQERQGASLFVGSEGLEVNQPAAGELEAFYDRDKERFRLPEKRSFSYGVLKGFSHEQAQKLEDDLAAKPDLKDVASRYQFQLHSVWEVSRRVLEGQKILGLEVLEKDPSLQQEILNEVFQLPVGQEPVVKGVGSGTYYVCQVTKSFPSHIPPFAAVQHQALALWQREQQEKRALEIGKKLLKAFE
ncbi:MAG: peptidylprolyl isomerase, partial [Holosporales bacterium]|nr:peptidylprolyl isomerase [Holosporales bacterium]